MSVRSSGTSATPLSGLRVLDLTHLTAGPMCTRLLADAGADVIKIEPPGGDPARHMPPLLTGQDGGSEGSYFVRLGVNKRSVVLDLKTDAGRDALLRLVDVSDVLVEAFRPGTMQKLGLGFDVLNARNPVMLVVSISGYGQPDVMDGPFSDRPSYDPIIQAMSGISHVTGDATGPPMTVGSSLADTVPGIFAAYSTLLAILQRQKDGLGRHVDVAQYDTMLWVNDRNITAYTLSGRDPARGSAVAFAPYGVFEASDGHVVLAVITDRQWSGLCDAIGRPDLIADERSRTGVARVANLQEMIGPILRGWSSRLTRAEIVGALLPRGVPVGPVQSAADVASCPQAYAREMIATVEHPTLGTLRVLGSAVKFSGLTGLPLRPPPALGHDTREVLEALTDLTANQLDHLAPATDAHLGPTANIRA